MKQEERWKAFAAEMVRLRAGHALMARNDPDLIDDLRDFLDDQADAEYFTDSPSPVPNDAMRLLCRLNEFWPPEEVK
jgi:hypothetical protein